MTDTRTWTVQDAITTLAEWPGVSEDLAARHVLACIDEGVVSTLTPAPHTTLDAQAVGLMVELIRDWLEAHPEDVA
jgi:hypothetical protein